MEDSTFFSSLSKTQPLIGPVVTWMETNGLSPEKLVANAMGDLRRRNRSLPRERRAQYAVTVLLGHFFEHWAQKHRRGSVKDLFKDDQARGMELQPFELAVIAAADEKAFTKLVPSFTRTKAIEHVGLTIGTADEFSAYVANNTRRLAHLFLKNFDSSSPFAARNSVRYLQKTAISWYLVHRTRPIRADAPNLQAYLDRSKRLSGRTALAIKLAYLPALLTARERAVLRDRYDFQGSIGTRIQVKDIAHLLRYKNAAALSRKLYRVREWCRRSASPVEGAIVEVDFN